ncbi:D-alanyl-D-alanine carboxypeptidase family protein [Yoonia sp.]|uniref:D-alanyl-D-alanine carboxypeptidase family protein n=1 Tax=Yoonia sp. TaxID=2212373 RepID=UPI0019F91FA2|nr:D-alanyl-D-alanine carboxypeptidase family protein [Yoonia sp.]MBE0412200.1 D-alanyl-D-alanine carboxypeptidase [Yoonia sp.]
MGQSALFGLNAFIFIFVILLAPLGANAAPYAAMVMDARTGEVLHARNADTRLHPASLTKMMTLYIAFQAIQRGEIGLDTEVTITKEAAAEPPSKLGLRTGQKIRFRYLLRAAAVKSANDAATAIGIAISGSEEAFATRMNRTAAAMGMTNTTFRNAHGLTRDGHLSTARDMTILGRHVIYDFPQYYNLFSRRSADAGIAKVNHTNRRWLDSYPGGDGVKTGYTRAAGFNLVASAQRGQERVIATVFGGSSTAARNARVTELMDMGFSRAPAQASVRKPTPPGAMVSEAPQVGNSGGKVVRVSGLVTRSLRPIARPATAAPTMSDDTLLLAAIDSNVIDAIVAEALGATAPAAAPAAPAVTPQARPAETVIMAAAPPALAEQTIPEVVTRISTSGGRHWGVNVGRYNTRHDAERVLLRVALNEMSTLDGSLRRVVQRSGGFDANFVGLTREGADLACRRLQARGTTCFMIGADS